MVYDIERQNGEPNPGRLESPPQHMGDECACFSSTTTDCPLSLMPDPAFDKKPRTLIAWAGVLSLNKTDTLT